MVESFKCVIFHDEFCSAEMDLIIAGRMNPT